MSLFCFVLFCVRFYFPVFPPTRKIVMGIEITMATETPSLLDAVCVFLAGHKIKRCASGKLHPFTSPFAWLPNHRTMKRVSWEISGFFSSNFISPERLAAFQVFFIIFSAFCTSNSAVFRMCVNVGMYVCAVEKLT